MSVTFAKCLLLFALWLWSANAEAGEATSALRFGPKRPVPSQLIDPSMYDDMVELEIKELKNHLTFSNSKLMPIVRVKVSCRCDTRHDRDAQSVKYEELWFGKDVSIGCRRSIPLPIKERDQVAIFLTVSTNNLTEAEIAACARALVRLRLETMLNRNALITVRVPSYALEELVAELEKENFYPYKDYRASINFLIPIPLETELGAREVMCFIPPTQ